MQEIIRIVLIGGPGTGKTSVIEQLQNQDFQVLPEISREVTLEAQKQGIEQLFLTDPLAFSDRLLDGRIRQFEQANKGINFYDRGIPDVPAYHRFTGDPIPDRYENASKVYRYDACFFFPVWEEIYQQDNERYENLETAKEISAIIKTEYLNLGYPVVEMPLVSISERISFIKKHV